MDGFCTFVLDRAAVQPPFCLNEKSDNINVSEINSSIPHMSLKERRFPISTLNSWLAEGTPNQTRVSASLRVVWISLHKEVRPWQLDVRKSSLQVILENFKLEEAFRYGFTSSGSFVVIPVSQPANHNTLVFSMCFPDLLAVTWRHDTSSGRTDAVCWADGWVSETMQDIMSNQRGWAHHPLFLALVASVMLVYLLDRDLVREVSSIAGVENRTKYCGIKHSHVGVARGDYASLSERMSGCAVSMAGLERIFKVLSEFLDDIFSYSQRYGVNDAFGLQNINSEVDKCVNSLKRRLRMQKIQLDYLSRRVAVQQTALFNLIAQKEAKVGIAVAEDSRTLASASKEDSTAMKTLAAVTVAFLPGTFVAAFFAMPLFEWNAVSDAMVVSKRFWIYWAVTVPLTFLTLVVWVLWTRRQAKIHKDSDKRAREELMVDIEGQKGSGWEGKEVDQGV